MPEFPDLTVYLEALDSRIGGETLTGVRIANPFVLRSVSPGIDEVIGASVTRSRRIGKRLVIELDNGCFIVVHLMIAGRLQWHDAGKRIPGKLGLAAFDFSSGTLVLTEASGKHRAAVHLVRGEGQLAQFDQGGLEVMDASADDFRAALSRENHTLKRAMTDQKILAGIGNAYSDEILHDARISPMRQVRHLSDDEWQRLYDSTRSVLARWVEILRDKTGAAWPKKVTAFHDEMAVHGKYRQPCPACGSPVQRIRYASNECNYCARCQNQGRVLADRGLSRLLKKDWPKTLEELDQIGSSR